MPSLLRVSPVFYSSYHEFSIHLGTLHFSRISHPFVAARRSTKKASVRSISSTTGNPGPVTSASSVNAITGSWAVVRRQSTSHKDHPSILCFTTFRRQQHFPFSLTRLTLKLSILFRSSHPAVPSRTLHLYYAHIARPLSPCPARPPSSFLWRQPRTRPP